MSVKKTGVILCLTLLITLGCNNAFFERGTQISIVNYELPPEFKLQGSGDALILFFHGPYAAISVEERAAKLNAPPIWAISPKPGTPISALPLIKYGHVPQSFTQNTPIAAPPPPLQEGRCYRIIVPTNGAHEGSLSFCIRDRKAVVVNNP
jgi:hypothetical protein